MPVRITFTSGFEVTGQGRKWGVRKSLLVSTLDAKLHTGELRFSNELLTAEALRDELQDFQSTCHRRADVVGNKARITSLSVTVCKPLRLRPKSDPDDILLVLGGGAPLVLRGVYAHENPYFDSGSLAAEYRIRLCWSGRPVPEKAEGGPPSGRPGAVLDESNAERFGQRRLGAVTH